MINRLTLLFAAILILSAMAFVFLKSIARPAVAPPYFAPGNALVYAHQGGSGLWPGNTLYAFTQCVDMGVDVLEMDVREAKGGELVVIHDATVDRTTNGSGLVKHLTPQQLGELDAGFQWMEDRERSYHYRGKGLTIPSLSKVLETFPHSRMNIEIKDRTPTAAHTLCDLLKRFGKERDVIVASFHHDALTAFRKACPNTATAATPGEVRRFFILSLLHLESLYSPTAIALQIPEEIGRFHLVTPRLIQAAHNRNMRVDVWTINQPDHMQSLIELGVDGIMTDRPDLLKKIMK